MPHQCLNCGKVFPSGSPEILKGCSDCGGKKFFYTEKPVSEQERQRLTEQANKDIKVLIREILSQSQHDQLQKFDLNGKEAGAVDKQGAADWVKITPGQGTTPVSAPTAAEAAKQRMFIPKKQTVKTILRELREKGEIGLEATTQVPTGELETTVPEPEKPPAKTRPKKKGKVKLRRKPGKKKRPVRPEVIAMREPGVYDIYLSKLLKGFPIIINKDGTYLVHLPSVFESMDEHKQDKSS
jgi:predicted  nucleic acid-binding Zn-ribbon protein